MHISKRIFDWSPAELRYAKQLGVRHIIGLLGAERAKPAWDFLELLQLSKLVESYGLELSAIEAPPTQVMREIVLAGPRRDEAIDVFCTCVESMAKADIHILAYNFALNPTWGRWRNGESGGGRGGAGLMSFNAELIKDAPISEAGAVSADEMWSRFEYFAKRVFPVAEKMGVMLACHPDDPPVPVLRGGAQILWNVDGMRRLIETVPSPNSGLLFCVGTVAEMDVNVIDTLQYFLEREKIFLVHFRNIKRLPGESLNYDEVFIEEGDVDMFEAMRTLSEGGFEGLLDPDHAPVMESDTQFGRQRGYAYAIGYMTALKKLCHC